MFFENWNTALPEKKKKKKQVYIVYAVFLRNHDRYFKRVFRVFINKILPRSLRLYFNRKQAYE